MKNWKFYNLLFLRVFIVITILFTSLYLAQKALYYNSLLVAVALIIALIEMYSFIKIKTSFYDKTILSILQNDYSTNFPEEEKKGNFKNLALLYNTLKEKQQEQTSKELIYRSILNNIDTATLILEKDYNDWNIFLMNDYFSSLFNVPKVSHWSYLKNYLPSLCEEIENTHFTELKTAISVKIEQQDLQTFTLQTSLTKSLDKEYFNPLGVIIWSKIN